MKNFLLSKVNISAFIIMLLGLQDYFANFDFSQMSVKSWITFGIGLLIVIFRTYFTSKDLSAPMKPKE